ncbi:hypothetical protein MF672_013300 [Actinomadura sp. ATCC 31491]|uniref:DUF3558 domain-containing protein n=1 Tax=Actinomadura luzonensis TaxID=2805427 RepID=A0ABT0FR04_9ACTN|nr:hypothetical protein [Actinomadura luzonensis]MCK2214762.1 hypothetical protein [Actinomadura luzonensis]
MTRTLAALGATLALATACTSASKPPVDKTPLPTTAAPPYICDHIPLRAVELMTGVREPFASGYFNLNFGNGLGVGGCHVFESTGDKKKLLDIDLTPEGGEDWVKAQLKAGGKPLPEILSGGIGFYTQGGRTEKTQAGAVLVKGKAQLFIGMSKGVEGRDNAADVIALMKLIAPKLIADANAPRRTKD